MRLRTFLLGLNPWLGMWIVASCGVAEGASPPQEVTELVRAVQRDAPLDFPLTELPERAAAAHADLQVWRETHPDQLDGLLALGQITWLLDRLEPHVASSTTDPHSGSSRNSLAQEQLRRANSLYPQTAAVHYWQAQLYASPVLRQIAGRLTARPIDLERTIEQMRRAFELDEQDAQVRNTLAMFLTDAYRDRAAFELLSYAGANSSPTHRLLLDLQAIPLPADAQLLAEDSRRFAEDQLARGRISDSFYLRARVYLLPTSAQQFEALCRKRWPDFRLLATKETSQAPAWRSHAMQVLLLGGGEPRPIASLKQLEVAAMDGISLTLIEMTAPPQTQRQQSPAGVVLPTDLGESFVYLYILNDRTIH